MKTRDKKALIRKLNLKEGQYYAYVVIDEQVGRPMLIKSDQFVKDMTASRKRTDSYSQSINRIIIQQTKKKASLPTVFVVPKEQESSAIHKAVAEDKIKKTATFQVENKITFGKTTPSLKISKGNLSRADYINLGSSVDLASKVRLIRNKFSGIEYKSFIIDEIAGLIPRNIVGTNGDNGGTISTQEYDD